MFLICKKQTNKQTKKEQTNEKLESSSPKDALLFQDEDLKSLPRRQRRLTTNFQRFYLNFAYM